MVDDMLNRFDMDQMCNKDRRREN